LKRGIPPGGLFKIGFRVRVQRKKIGVEAQMTLMKSLNVHG